MFGLSRRLRRSQCTRLQLHLPVERQHHPLPLKIFFLIVAISLMFSTLTGIYMAYKYSRNARVMTALLVLGAAIPAALVFV